MSIGDYDPNKATGNFIKKKYFDIEKDISNVFRILPPFASLAGTNRIATYWSLHFGFLDSQKKNRPLVCTFKKDRDGVVSQKCPLCDFVSMLKARLETMKAQTPNSPLIAELDERLKKMNVDKAYYLNVLTPSNQIGILKLRYKPFKDLEQKIKKVYTEDMINAVSKGEGIFWDIRRSGMGRDTIYSVDAATTSFKGPDGRMSKSYTAAMVDDAIIARMEAEAADLQVLYKTFSEEELIQVASGDPKALDRLFARPEKVMEPEDNDEPVDATPATTVAVVTAPAANVRATPAAASAASVSTITPTGVNLATSQDEDDLVAQFLRKA